MADHDDPYRAEYDDEPELQGYEPHGDRPLRSARLLTVMRVVVVIGLIGLLLPGILVTATTASSTAERTCGIYTAYYVPEAVDFDTRFEFFGPDGVGWNCYAIGYGGEELLVTSLGLIPGGVPVPSAPLENS